ncbi:MAG: hypothetical protein M1832_001162 [Thelocarpon impressellum]|nr:MAG: hypothetical protein M1832_001162 [Thelocarpon impressellum]
MERNGSVAGRTRSLCRTPSLSSSRLSALRQRSFSPSPAPSKRDSYLPANVRRWDGTSRVTTQWDGLRRDPELWHPDGDCVVHLYGRGVSRRGPSFRVPFSAIRAARCGPLLERYSAQTLPESPESLDSAGSSNSSDSGYFGYPARPDKCELYVPAPPKCSREEAFAYHLNTRNFFAWMLGKPIVATHLGRGMADLLDRMNLFRDTADNVQDFLEYIDAQQYSSFRECPDLALASLYVSERFMLKDRWIDAFAHCVGLNDRLICSSEFEPVSRVSKSLITRAKLEMDIRMGRCSEQLSSFLDDELSKSHLGLGKGARAHLDRFRSFLHSFYVAKFGYWPPVEGSGLSKETCGSMYVEFRNLYDYLVDPESTPYWEDNLRPPTGGLCVYQNVIAFDQRHRYTSLPHPLPLLPEEMVRCLVPSRKRSMGSVRFSRCLGKAAKADRKSYTLAALSGATNVKSMETLSDPLVRAYMRFERECTLEEEEKVTAADARKVRWLLIYGVLQTLISVTSAPPEVRHTDGVSYPLCCQTAGTPPWQSESRLPPSKRGSAVSEITVPEAGPKYEIQPDVDYFAFKTSVTANMSVRHPQPRRSGFHEILIHGYGNGLMDAEVQPGTSISAPSTPEPRASTQQLTSRWSGSSDGSAFSSASSTSDDGPPGLSGSVSGSEGSPGGAETPRHLPELAAGAAKGEDPWASAPELQRYLMV